MNRSVLLDLTLFLRIRRLGMICCIASLFCLNLILFVNITFISLPNKCLCRWEHAHLYMGTHVHVSTCVHLGVEVRSHHRCYSPGDTHHFLRVSHHVD